MITPALTAHAATVDESAHGRSFIEAQFPVDKLSKESYKERKAGANQTITALGKWWGRKPLVLVRAIILGLLLPATDDPGADRDTFLALMTMDDDGLWRRRKGSISAKDARALFVPRERAEYLTEGDGKVAWRRGLSKEQQQTAQRIAFGRMGYDARLAHCKRPEEIDGPGPEAWTCINRRLGTGASSLSELVAELGQRRFGGPPRVGDVFCGGGSIPFEAARIGCDAYGSDLNPAAALLTWGALNIVGGGREAVERVAAAQRRVFDAVQAQVDVWGIERNEEGWVADAYLYCAEVLDPSTNWTVPLAPSWLIAEKGQVIAKLVPDTDNRRFEIDIIANAADTDFAAVKDEGTWNGGVRCPVDRDGHWLPISLRQTTGFERLRGPNGLRLWENEDIMPHSDDVFQERLYCIRWLDPKTGDRHFRAPTEADLDRERRVVMLLRERFTKWQADGFIPSRLIEQGEKTDEPMRTRGWTRWHHLFNPRQLLIAGLFASYADTCDKTVSPFLLLMQGRLADWNSRLSGWNPYKAPGIGFGERTFYNQAINTLANYSCRSASLLHGVYGIDIYPSQIQGKSTISLSDARQVGWNADIWITDPGYGDVILYDELSEFFLAWYERRLPDLFPGWYSDSKRALSVKGEGAEFRTTLAACYRRTAEYMRDDGFQVVMFTHQDPEVWADLTLVLWAAGLHVSAAWTIATETGASGVKQGNYVQGTVVLVLRKRHGAERGDLSDIYPDIQAEVRRQVRTMREIDPRDDPNFGDADYQLAAYAAALRVLTAYGSVGDIDVERELRRQRAKKETSPIAALIERAVRIASDELVPPGIEATVWRKLGPEERLYVKGIAVEAGGEAREGVYQELARGYGAAEYRSMLASRTANRVRLKTPSEFAGRDLRTAAGDGFAASTLRHLLHAVYIVARDPEGGPRAGRTYLRQELPGYWDSRATLAALLGYLHTVPSALPHWSADAEAARLLLGAVENDSL